MDAFATTEFSGGFPCMYWFDKSVLPKKPISKLLLLTADPAPKPFRPLGSLPPGWYWTPPLPPLAWWMEDARPYPEMMTAPEPRWEPLTLPPPACEPRPPLTVPIENDSKPSIHI